MFLIIKIILEKVINIYNTKTFQLKGFGNFTIAIVKIIFSIKKSQLVLVLK